MFLLARIYPSARESSVQNVAQVADLRGLEAIQNIWNCISSSSPLKQLCKRAFFQTLPGNHANCPRAAGGVACNTLEECKPK